jgi:hypothetical protein
MSLGPKTGKLVGCWAVREQDEILAITSRGRMIRVAVQETPLLSRTAMGNITVRLDEGDWVADCGIVHGSHDLEKASSPAKDDQGDSGNPRQALLDDGAAQSENGENKTGNKEEEGENNP